MTDFRMDTIRDQLTLILIANDMTVLSKIKLFELMVERIDNVNDDINIKEKYAIIFRSLPIYNPDIYFHKSNNFIVYNPDINNELNKLIIDDSDIDVELYNFTDDNYNEDYNNKFIDKNKVNEYIVENMSEELNYKDPITGNTIYHDIIKDKNFELIDKLIKRNKMSLYVENNNKETPLSLINDNKMFIKIIDYLNEQNNSLKSIIKINESHIKVIKKRSKIPYCYSIIIIAIFLPVIFNCLYI